MYLFVAMYLRCGYRLDSIPVVDSEKHVYESKIDACIPAQLIASRQRR